MIEATLQKAPPPEELARYLQEFAHGMRGAFSRRGDAFVVTLGSALSLHPSTLRLAIRITGDRITARTRTPPFARAKAERIVRYRLQQLQDYIDYRMKAGAKERYFTPQVVAPLGPVARGWDIPLQAGWLALGAVLSFLLVLLVLTLAGMVVIGDVQAELAARGKTLHEIGRIPLPPPDEPVSLFGCGLLLAGPIAFFFAAFHWIACALCESSPKLDWLPQWSALAACLVSLTSFIPAMNVLLAVAIALAVPVALQLGMVIPWALKRERALPPPDPRFTRFVLAGAVLGVAAAAAALPRFGSWEDALQNLVRFRDTAMLSNSVGRSLAYFYYRHTLYAAEVSKPVLGPLQPGGRRISKQQSVALVVLSPRPENLLAELRRHGLELDPRDPAAARERIQTRFYDLYLIDGTYSDLHARVPDRRRLVIVDNMTPDQLVAAVEKASDALFRHKDLAFLAHLGWTAVYYAGPLAVLYLALSAAALPLAVLYRRLNRRRAHLATALILVISVAVIGLFVRSSQADLEALRRLRESEPSDDWAEWAAHPNPAVRYEMVYRLARSIEGKPESLARLREGKLPDAVIRLLHDPDVRVRWWAAHTAGLMEVPRAVEPLLKLLEDPELFVRYKACGALGTLLDRPMREIRKQLREGGKLTDAQRRLREHTLGVVIPALEHKMRTDLWYVGSYALGAVQSLRD